MLYNNFVLNSMLIERLARRDAVLFLRNGRLQEQPCSYSGESKIGSS